MPRQTFFFPAPALGWGPKHTIWSQAGIIDSRPDLSLRLIEVEFSAGPSLLESPYSILLEGADDTIERTFVRGGTVYLTYTGNYAGSVTVRLKSVSTQQNVYVTVIS